MKKKMAKDPESESKQAGTLVGNQWEIKKRLK